MKIRNLIFAAFFITGAGLISSCTKTDNPTDTSKTPPVVILSPSATTAAAADLVKIGYTSTAVNGIQKIHIESQYQQNAKIVERDTTFASTKTADDEVLNYRVPDTAGTGQQVAVTFTITDAKGNATTKTATITITGSRPRITVNADKTTAAAGDSVTFQVDVLSSDNSLTKLEVGENVNNAGTNTIATFHYSATNAIHKTYVYHVSASAKSGDSIYLLFTATNLASNTNFESKTITVK